MKMEIGRACSSVVAKSAAEVDEVQRDCESGKIADREGW